MAKKKVDFDGQFVKKYAFWACVPVGFLIAVFGFYWSIGAVAQSIDSRKKTLESTRKEVQTVRNAKPHPNKDTLDEVVKETAILKTSVAGAWVTLAEDQGKRNVWKGLDQRALEDISGSQFLGNLRTPTLRSYVQFARKEIQNLVMIVQPCKAQNESFGGRNRDSYGASPRGSARRDIGAGRGAAPRVRPNTSLPNDEDEENDSDKLKPKASEQGVVVWDPPELRFTIEDFQRIPQPYEVWLTQEEIWVYDALLNVIKASNEKVKARSPRSASVRGIAEILIGQPASEKLQTQSQMQFAIETVTGTGMTPKPAGEGMMSGTGIGGKIDEQVQAINGRYVDAAGMPLQELNTAAPFRRMPVYLSLVIAEKSLPDILIECANCPMPIDVLWVRMNPQESLPFEFDQSKAENVAYAEDPTETAASSTPHGGNTRRETGGGRTLVRPSTPGTRNSRSDGPKQELTAGGQFGAGSVQVEIYGCINIFSQPPELAGTTKTNNPAPPAATPHPNNGSKKN